MTTELSPDCDFPGAAINCRRSFRRQSTEVVFHHITVSLLLSGLVWSCTLIDWIVSPSGFEPAPQPLIAFVSDSDRPIRDNFFTNTISFSLCDIVGFANLQLIHAVVPTMLLDHMCKFVCDQGTSCTTLRLKTTGPENNVRANGVSVSINGSGGLRRTGISMHANVAEISFKFWLKEISRGAVQRQSGRTQDVMYDWRCNGRRRGV
jgi:hypothetical protein